MRPSAIGGVIRGQVAGSNPEVELLPFGVLSNANPAVKVGAIILMDGVTIDIAEPMVGVCQPLEPWVLRPELCISAVTWHKVPCTCCAASPPPVTADVLVVTFRWGWQRPVLLP